MKLQLSWSFQGGAMDLADLQKTRVGDPSAPYFRSEIPQPVPGEVARYVFHKIPPHTDDPPRPECGTNNLYLCEVRECSSHRTHADRRV